jgi:hypothetical protein
MPTTNRPTGKHEIYSTNHRLHGSRLSDPRLGHPLGRCLTDRTDEVRPGSGDRCVDTTGNFEQCG